jgi:hypothetical protein
MFGNSVLVKTAAPQDSVNDGPVGSLTVNTQATWLVSYSWSVIRGQFTDTFTVDCLLTTAYCLLIFTVAGQRGILTRLRCVPMHLLNDARGVKGANIITELKERANSFSFARSPRI